MQLSFSSKGMKREENLVFFADIYRQTLQASGSKK